MGPVRLPPVPHPVAEHSHADAEREMVASAELLWRQVHPGWISQGTVTSQAFRPTPKDNDRLSTSRSSMIDAEGAYLAHEVRDLPTAGTWGVTVDECVRESLCVLHDGGSAELPAEHASVCFEGKSRTERVRASKTLRDHAMKRGRCHPPGE